MKRFVKWISLLLALITLLLTAGCSNQVPSIMDSGADAFAAGKAEENYYLPNSGLLLDELLDKYTGLYYTPVSIQIDVDDIDPPDPIDPSEPPDQVDPSEPPDPVDPDTVTPTEPPDPVDPDTPDPTDSTEPEETEPPAPTVPTVASWDEFLDLCYDTYLTTADNLTFETVGGYTLDLSTDLNEALDELRRRDPIITSSYVDQWWWSISGNTYSVDIVYEIDPATLQLMREETPILVDAAVAQIDTAGKSDYEIIYAVNEYLCDLVYYPPNKPYPPEVQTAYGAFHDGVVVCEGYACATKLMLNRLGIRCDIQVGVCTNGELHAWNLVELDGQWYQMDVCWNDGGNREEFLLVSDDYMKKSRSWDESKYPACPVMYDHG